MAETSRETVEALFRAAVAAADPAPALVAALEGTPAIAAGRLYLVSTGKASLAMADTAMEWSRSRGKPVTGAVVVSPAPGPARHLPGIHYLTGDHPVPGTRSHEAALAIDRLTRELRTDDEVWVLLSGGTSSLIGTPVTGVTREDFVALHQLLLGAGVDIHTMNQIRKRVSLWSGGRLALGLSPARVRVFAISDVAGDDLAVLGSGPCAPDPTSAAELRGLLASTGLWARLPESVSRYVDDVVAGLRGETPKFDDPRFSRVQNRVIANTGTALNGAAREAEARGIPCHIQAELEGDATEQGAAIAELLLDAAARGQAGGFLWGGETTVRLDMDGAATPRDPRLNPAGVGGRCQDLALSAALRLAGADAGNRITILAAGTDGRDGPTDAAGAIVDGTTTTMIHHPERHLARHDAYPALERAGALLITGPTGTNVRDVVVGLVR